MKNKRNWPVFRQMVEDQGKVTSMMCCSPDFTHPDKKFRGNEIEKEKHWIDMFPALGGSYCRVLSGQRRPELTIDKGIQLAADCIYECLPCAQERNVTLILENHCKVTAYGHFF